MRWTYLAAAALALGGQAFAHPGHAPLATAAKATITPEKVELTASNGRKLPVTVWPGRGKGGPVVVFGHGLGGEPEAYRALFERWTTAGTTVVAPIEPDSHANPGHGKIDLPTGFGLRTEDLMIVRGYVAHRFPKAPAFLAGHSYGSLFAMIGGGAVTAAGPLKGPPVAGVVAFSTPGKIQGVVTPDSFATLKVPMLVVTGTDDTVPGFVPNAADHRFPFDTAAPGDKMLVTFKGGTHDLVARQGESSDSAARLSAAFFEAYGQGGAAARAKFRRFKSTGTYTVEVR